MDDSEFARQGQHRRAWDVIPWLVNGSATTADRVLAEAHLAECADCSDELTRQTQWRAAMLSSVGDGHDPQPALQRLWSRIDRVEGDTVAAPSRPPTPNAGRGWTPWLAAAVVLQAIGLAALIGVVWERPRASDYITLSRPEPTPPSASIRLVPEPGLRVGELQSLLSQHGLHIVGSSDDGRILSVAPRSAGSAPTAAALTHLRAAPGVLLAEPIGTLPPGPH